MAGPESMSKYELAKLIAEKEGLNENLIVGVPREVVSSSYPPNTSLDSSKLIGLGFSPRSLSSIDRLDI